MAAVQGYRAGPNGRAVEGVSLRPLACWNVGSNPAGAWMSVCCECCVLWGRGQCVGLITRPEESYTDCGASLCDLETWWMGGGHGPRWASAPQGGNKSSTGSRIAHGWYPAVDRQYAFSVTNIRAKQNIKNIEFTFFACLGSRNSLVLQILLQYSKIL